MGNAPDTQIDAFVDIRDSGRASTLRAKALEVYLSGEAYTSDEVAEILKEDRYSVRPRITELINAGKLIDSGFRKKNTSGKYARAYKLNK